MSQLVAPGGRSFSPGQPFEDLSPYFQAGFKLKYRGVPMQKTPFDIAIYMHLFSKARPKTVIEVGSNYGGSALFFADMMRRSGPDARVISVDVNLPKRVRDPRVTFLQGDALNLAATLTPELLAACPRPWLISEDCAHIEATTRGVLDFFHPMLRAGEYLVVEDGVVEEAKDDKHVEQGPNQALHAFLTAHPGDYEIDAELCDFFGYNVTANPNGYLRRVR